MNNKVIDVFASNNGKLKDSNGITIRKDRSFDSNTVAYRNGFDTLDVDSVNGAFNFVTQNLKHSTQKGVENFKNGYYYRKDDLVLHNDNLYLSLISKNGDVPEHTASWKKLTGNSNKTIASDSNPIGTILTIPIRSANPTNYIDYVPGASFNRIKYPDLYLTLQTDTFEEHSRTQDLPLGTILHLLSNDELLSSDWIEFYPGTDISNYPDLKKLLADIALNLDDEFSKQQWENALQTNRLPNFELASFCLSSGRPGKYTKDSVRSKMLSMLPAIVEDTAKLYNVRSKKEWERTATIAQTTDDQVSGVKADVVVSAQDISKFANQKGLLLTSIDIGDANATVTKPKTLETRLYIKAVKNASISRTHKQIIKVSL